MTKFYLFIMFIFFCFTSCNNNISNRDISRSVQKVGSISFALDSLTSQFNHFQIVSKDGRNYLYMLTQYNNRFVVYDLETQKMVKTFEFVSDAKSPISIGNIPPSGFSFISSDSIILYDYNNQRIFMGTEKGEKELLISLRKSFPSQIDHWGASFQGAEPLMINDSILSITGAVVAGIEPFMNNQMSDLHLNLNSKEAWKETEYPSSYLPGNYYTTARLRPSRALNEKQDLVYYSFLNSDSIQVLNLKTRFRISFLANHINSLPNIETNDLNDYRKYSSGNEAFFYQNTQGAFLAIYYNSYRNQIIRMGFEGISVSEFNISDYMNGLYNQERILSFYNAEDYTFLGNVTIPDVGYDFMFFDENNYYMAEISQNKSEDELVFTKFKYPNF